MVTSKCQRATLKRYSDKLADLPTKLSLLSDHDDLLIGLSVS